MVVQELEGRGEMAGGRDGTALPTQEEVPNGLIGIQVFQLMGNSHSEVRPDGNEAAIESSVMDRVQA
jgi:hypothetical protein